MVFVRFHRDSEYFLGRRVVRATPRNMESTGVCLPAAEQVLNAHRSDIARCAHVAFAARPGANHRLRAWESKEPAAAGSRRSERANAGRSEAAVRAEPGDAARSAPGASA
jgi:hypothetical protein